jgi:hypothetical protein
VLVAQCSLSILPSWGQIPDGQSFIETLREHKKNGTERDFAKELREAIKRDKKGNLVKAISEDPELNSAIFHNIDAVPDKFVELVIASWLEDDNQWGARGGFYHSPAHGISEALRQYIRPADAADPPTVQKLYFVLEDKNTRAALAKVLRTCYNEEKLSLDERSKRRTEAWRGIVDILEESFPLLLEGDTKRRAEAAGEQRPEPGLFPKKLRQEGSDEVTSNQPSGQANNSNISLRPEKRHDATPDKISKTLYVSGKFIYWLMSALALVIFVTAMILLFKRRNP